MNSNRLFLGVLRLLDDGLQPSPKSGGVGVHRHGDSVRQQVNRDDLRRRRP
jgi:hypothetical protein